MPTNSAVFLRVPLVTHAHLDPAGFGSRGSGAARMPYPRRGGRGGENCSSPRKRNCWVLKGDLNLCMKGRRVFAPDLVLPASAFYFGWAFSASFWAVPVPVKRVPPEPSPAAGCHRPGRGVPWGALRCAPLPQPGSPAWLSPGFPIDVSHLQRALCCCFFFIFLFFLLHFLLHKSHLSICLLLEALFLSSSPFL